MAPELYEEQYTEKVDVYRCGAYKGTWRRQRIYDASPPA